MVFSTFVKLAKHLEKLLFFQSSHPYMHSHSLVRFNKYFNKRWNDDPHPSTTARRFLTIACGHYGLYYAIFSLEGDTRKKTTRTPAYEDRTEVPLVLETFALFFISKVKRETTNNVKNLQSARKGSYTGVRAYLTVARAIKDSKKSSEPDIREIPFEESFSSTQASQIASISLAGPDVNRIYPLYQSLKRNGLPLPSIELYDKVLESLLVRSLDSSSSLEDVENRLTNLLTVYQDLLAAAVSNKRLKPTQTTYLIVLQGVFQGALDAKGHDVSMQFSKLAVDLLMSIRAPETLLQHMFMEQALAVLKLHRSLVTKTLVERLTSFELLDGSAAYYDGLLALTPYIVNLGIGTNKDAYDFVAAVYAKGKSPEIYEATVEALVLSDNFPVATQFLDEFLVENGLSSSKASSLAHIYLTSIARLDLVKAYNLTLKFRDAGVRIAYSTYDILAGLFVGEFLQKPEIREAFYPIMWKLYDFGAIGGATTSRDTLLSVSIDIGDHERVFQLIKDMLQGDLAQSFHCDLAVLAKLCAYLYNGSVVNSNRYYYDLMWTLIERHEGSANDVVCLLAPYMVHDMDMILNSLKVKQVLDEFHLANDNIYGLATLMGVLMNQEVDAGRTFKIAQFHAQLVNEFEDVDNHYIELSDEVVQFRHQLKQSFVSLMERAKRIEGFQVSADIVDACNHLDVDLGLPKRNITPADYTLDMSYKLSVDYEANIESFISNFREGYNFSELTWRIVINPTFVTEQLKKHLGVKAFVDRIMASGLIHDTKIDLLVSLVNYKCDDVNVEMAKLKCADTDVVVALARALKDSQNVRLEKLMVAAFPTLLQANSDMVWVAELLEALAAKGNHGAVYELSQLIDLNSLALTNASHQGVFSAACESLVSLDKLDEFTLLFKLVADKQQILLLSDKLLRVFMKFYVHSGAFQVAIDKFASVQDRKCIKDMYQFSLFMVGRPATHVHRALSQPSFHAMASYLHQTKHRIDGAFVNECTQQLIAAAQLNVRRKVDNDHIVGTFHNLIKSLKTIGMTKLLVQNLIGFIKLLTITNQAGQLHVLLNKLINNQRLTPLVNFYFLEVLITKYEGIRLLKELKRSFQQLDDKVNLHAIHEFALHYEK